MIRVAVIGGGRNCEHDVSLASAASVTATLAAGPYDVVALTIDRQGAWCDDTGRRIGLPAAVRVLQTCAAVLPVVHGPRGEDGTLAALCELAQVPCVGSGVGAGAVATDKWATKLLAGSLGIATAHGGPHSRAGAVAHHWSGPVVVKPVAAGSSHGVTLVRSPVQLAPAVEAAFALDDRILIEDLVVGREIDIAVLGRPDGSRMVAPALEVVVDGIFDHATKYGGAADLRIPALLGETDRERLERAAVAMYDGLGCAGVARVDFFLTADGPVLNEVNTVPGFTEQSQVPRMFAAAGMPYAELLDVLVRDVLT